MTDDLLNRADGFRLGTKPTDDDVDRANSLISKMTARIRELERERDVLRSWDDYFRSQCGFKRDGRPSPECLDEWIAAGWEEKAAPAPVTVEEAARDKQVREQALREAADRLRIMGDLGGMEIILALIEKDKTNE